MKLQLPHALRIALIGAILCGTASSHAADLTYTGANDEDFQNAVAGDRLVIDLTTYYLRPTSTTIAADVYVADFALWGFSGNPQRVYTFTGSLNDYKHFTNDESTPVANISMSGNRQGYTGDANSAKSTDGSNIHPIHLVFNGAMSNFTGNIESVGSAMQVSFGAGSGDQTARRLSASGGGDIMIGGRTVNYNFGAGGDVIVNNGNIIVSNTIEGITSTAGGSSNALNPELSFTGGANYLVSSTVTADKLRIDGSSTANFSNSVTSTTSQTLSGTANFSSVANLSGATSITGSVTAKTGASLSLLGTTTIDGGSLAVETGATLTIGGTFFTDSAFTNNGTLLFDSNVLINLSELSRDASGNYTLFTGNDSASFDNLTAANISSSTLGYNVTFNADGTINFALAGATHNMDAAFITDWTVGTELNGVAFNDGDIVNFSNAGNFANLGGDIAPSIINIQENSHLFIETSGHTLNAGEINIAGVLNLFGAELGADTKINAEGEGSQLIIEINHNDSKNLSNQLENYTGDVTILSGKLSFTTAADMAKMNSSSNFTIDNSASLELGAGYANAASISLKNDSTLILNGVTGFANALSAEGNATLSVTANSTLNQNISGTGTITRTGTGKLTITSNQSHTGTLDLEAGVTQLGNEDKSSRTIAYDTIIVREGATFTFQNGATQFGTIQLDGGTYHNEDASNSANTIEKLHITKNSNITTNWNGTYNVAELTGNGNLSIVESNDRGTADPFAINITKLKNYSGVISVGNDSRLDLSISSIEQEVGYSATIEQLADGLSNTNLSISGEGSVTFNTTLNVSNTLSLSGGGNVELSQNSTVQNITIDSSKLHIQSNLNVGESISLSNDAQIVTSSFAITQSSNSLIRSNSTTISRIDTTQDAVLSQSSISNLALSNVSIDTSSALSITNSTLTNSKIIINGSGSLTLNDVELLNSQVEASVSSLGTQSLTTLEKTTESMLVFSMTGLDSSITIAGTLALDIHLTESQFDEFVAQYEGGGMVALELVGFTEDFVNKNYYNNIALNFYDKNDQLYVGGSINALGYTTTTDGHLALYIPEPSTATLSLLALAGLLARRRRKTA